MKLPKNVEAVFPLDICEACSNCSPKIEFMYRMTDVDGEYEHYVLKCEYERGCTYSYRKGAKNEQSNN